jgi:type I restriction enzyme, S subunit
MNNLWQQIKLGEVLTPVSRVESVDPAKTYNILGAHWYAKGLYTKDVLIGTGIQAPRVYRVQAGDFVYNRLFAWKGSFALATEENDGCYVSNEFPCFSVNSDRLDGKYLWLSFSRNSAWDEALGLSTGGTPTSRNRLKEGQFLGLTIPLPPVLEQRRIVARIEELSAKIEEVRVLRSGILEQVAVLIAAEITKLFSSGPRHDWRSGCLGDYVIDDCYGTSEKTTDDSTATPILRMGNIQNGHLDLRNLKYLPISETGRDKLILKKGDILVNRTNSAELVGKCAVFDAPGEYGFASYLIRIRLDPDRVNPRLVAAYINSPAGREYMFRERKQMTGQANVNSKKVKALPIVLPNLPEQRHIVAYLDDLQEKVDTVKKLQEESETELNALMPSILSRAFAGEL